MASGPITLWQIDKETVETVSNFIFLGSKITEDVTAAMKLKDTCTLEEKLWPTQTAYWKAEILLCQRSPSSQSYDFSSSHVWVWELDYKQSWTLKNWWFWTVALEKTLESSLDCKEIQLVSPKGNQSWIFIGRTDTEAEAPILDHLMWRTDSLEKILMQGKIEDGRRKDEDEMVG